MGESVSLLPGVLHLTQSGAGTVASTYFKSFSKVSHANSDFISILKKKIKNYLCFPLYYSTPSCILFCFLHQFPRAQCLLYSSSIPDGATFLALMKRFKNEAVATYPQPPVLFTSSNCSREISVVASFLTAFQIFLQLIPFHLIIFSPI